MRWPLLILFLFAPTVSAQSELSPELLLLAKIKLAAAQNLERLPNYTCLETIERSNRRGSGKFQLVDVLRMEVANVGSKEMFAWPGSTEFENRELHDMVGYGAIGNGSFALHARSIFLSNTPDFTYVGERIREGRKTIRFDYRVPQIQSGYRLRVRPAEGIVGYRGSFWVDADTLDLIRLEIVLQEIPPHLPISAGAETLEYARAKIGAKDFLLPGTSELLLTDLSGDTSRNVTRFSNCRQFTGESVISFDDAPSSVVRQDRGRTPIVLEGDLDIELKLDTAVEAGVSAVGDPIRAITSRDARRRGKTIVPKGAVVTGRIVKMRRRVAAAEPYWQVGLDFTRVEFEDKYAGLQARMELSSVLPAGLRSSSFSSHPPNNGTPELVPDPRIGILYIRGDRGRLPIGLRLVWRTETPSEEKQ